MFGRRVLGLAVVVLALASAPARAAEQADIDKAIARGVDYLKAAQERSGIWQHRQSGATSLCALTLLECGVKPDDPAIKAAATVIRDTSPVMTETYSISLAIMFLDRLGDPGDVPLIESLTVRLLAGQSMQGGWGYNCPSVSEDEVARLRTSIKNRAELKGGTGLPMKKRTLNDVSPEIRNQLNNVINRQGQIDPRMLQPQQGGQGRETDTLMFGGDNSNTQFATLALWIGRRQGLPVDKALERVDARFRQSQNNDGSWGYMSMRVPPGTPGEFMMASPSMTCAGVLGLTIAHGVSHDPDIRKKAAFDPSKDRSLEAALNALSTLIPKEKAQPQQIGQRFGNSKAYYMLWSLERVCMALNLETLGGKDWYNWGADMLLSNQDKSGGWHGEYTEGNADTCFALLFLRRANLLKDISASLKGRTRDTVTLRTGGVGGGFTLKNVKQEDPRPKDLPKPKPIPSTEKETEEDALSNKLVNAKEGERGAVLKELEQTKGAKYSLALALAIPRLSGEDRDLARDALQARMLRLTADSRAGYFKDMYSELRRAAILASASKQVMEHVPLIIERLDDPDASVARAAAVALQILTKEDFGPAVGATPEEHAKAVKEWKEWWKKKSGG